MTLRIRKWALSSFLGGAAMVGVVFSLPHRYESSASFTPAVSGASSISSVAQSLGLDAGGDATQSPDFYSDLVTTDEIYSRVLAQLFPAPEQSSNVRRVIEEYAEPSTDTLHQLDVAMRRLRGLMTVSPSRRTGIVKLTVRASTPARAQYVAGAFIGEVDRYNQLVRRRQVTANRQFIEGRLAIAREDLRRREDSLKVFLEGNRNLENSPQLKLEGDRLTRTVLLQHSIVTALAQSYEQSRIDEVRDTPGISIVQPPIYPRKAASRNGALLVLVGVVLGALVGLFWGADGRARIAGWRRDLFAEHASSR